MATGLDRIIEQILADAEAKAAEQVAAAEEEAKKKAEEAAAALESNEQPSQVVEVQWN